MVAQQSSAAAPFISVWAHAVVSVVLEWNRRISAFETCWALLGPCCTGQHRGCCGRCSRFDRTPGQVDSLAPGWSSRRRRRLPPRRQEPRRGLGPRVYRQHQSMAQHDASNGAFFLLLSYLKFPPVIHLPHLKAARRGPGFEFRALTESTTSDQPRGSFAGIIQGP